MTAPAMTPLGLARLSLVASLAALGVAYLSQYAGGMQPCPLCLLQRLPYGVIVLLGVVAVVLIGRGRRPLMLIVLIGGLFALDAGVAFYHVGVEGGWFEGLAACSSGGETPATVDALRAMLLDKPAAAPCDLVQWSLFGVSMAGYNMLYAATMAAITLIGAAALLRETPTE